MAIKINHRLTAPKLAQRLERVFELSATKLSDIEKTWDPGRGTPVFTVKGRYTARGWTEWTQGFQYGSAILQFDATGEQRYLELGRRNTVARMAPHVSHTGVHDHGFNNFSTYGNLRRLMLEGRIPANESERDFYELALKTSGAIQAARWTTIADGRGYIYSFNGPHSLFIDTVRSLRSLAVAHQLGHVLMGEGDRPISLLQRLLEHAWTSADYSVYYGEGRDLYDAPGRVAHESVFNLNDGNYRCPNSQQGYSPFSTWTRGLAWAILGFAEELEFVESLPNDAVSEVYRTVAAKVEASGRTLPTQARDKAAVRDWMLRAARATADFYIRNACTDGIPMWDTGAPNLHRLGDYLSQASDPYNAWEPVDSSAAAIAAQGLVRLGNYLSGRRRGKDANRYRQAGLTIAATLFDEPYLSTGPRHQGLILHSVYHRPNGWDHVAPRQRVPNGESSMWGDYHALELALVLLREARGESAFRFFDPADARP